MDHIKNMFKIILVVQLLACVLALYGHPDAEIIDFGSPTQPSRDQLIIDAAVKRGMDGDAVAELLRTKKPVVRKTTTPSGFNKTTTYKLEPDGSISSKSVLQKRNRYVYNSGNIPDSIPIDDLRKSPSGSVTRTFTDSDGNKVTQTIAVSKPKTATGLDEDNVSDDWFNKSLPSWVQKTPEAPSLSSVHSKPITRTFTDPEFSDPEIFSRRTSTRTYLKPNEEKHSVHATANSPDAFATPKFPAFSHTNWPGFDFSAFGTVPEDLDDWEVLHDPQTETTTKRNFETWTSKTWEWPTFPTHPTRTTTTRTPSNKPKEPKNPAPRPHLPTLEDFLKTQYKTPTFTPTNANTESKTRKVSATTTPQPTTSTTAEPKVIKIDDLPVGEVLQNSNPADDALLKILPPHLTPRTPAKPALTIDHIPPSKDVIEIYTPKMETNIRTYSKTHIGHDKPSLKDLDPQMQEILRKAGISPDDITNIQGDTITKTRREPDGRTITTTYKVNTVPSQPVASVPPSQHHHFMPSPISTNTLKQSYKPITPSRASLQPFKPHLSPISEFLAKLGLTKVDIKSRDDKYTKTFIDENGDVLTATFVLSSPKGIESGNIQQVSPLK